MFKSFFYIVACAVVFLILIKVYDDSVPSQSAVAFEWEKTVDVYFVDKMDTKTKSCEATLPLKRTVLNAETLGPGAIEALIKGLTAEEVGSGKYLSSVNSKTLLQKFEIKNRVAYVDFGDALNKGVVKSCTVVAIRSQIENTLNALPDIDSVVISINGKTSGTLEP